MPCPTSIHCAPYSLTTSFEIASSCGNDALPPLPDVDEMPGDRRRRRHRRRNQMGAALKTLAALEIAVRGRGKIAPQSLAAGSVGAVADRDLDAMEAQILEVPELELRQRHLVQIEIQGAHRAPDSF